MGRLIEFQSHVLSITNRGHMQYSSYSTRSGTWNKSSFALHVGFSLSDITRIFTLSPNLTLPKHAHVQPSIYISRSPRGPCLTQLLLPTKRATLISSSAGSRSDTSICRPAHELEYRCVDICFPAFG